MSAEHCPVCDRPFEGINDYPKIVINDLVVSPIPKFVRDTPHDENISGKIREFSRKPEVQDYLKKLSSIKGGVVSLKDIKPDLPEYEDRETPGYFRLYGRYYLHILDTETPGSAKVAVMSHINTKVGWGFTEIAKLAEIRYDGVLNYPKLQRV